MSAAPRGEAVGRGGGFQLERLLPFACIAAAVVLFASELMTTFQVEVPVQGALCNLDAVDRHHYAMMVLAGFAVVGVVAAIGLSSRAAAMAVAVSGGIALVIFLTVDLPDATATGTLGDTCGSVAGSLVEADVVPRAGFWLELVGALGLTVSGTALATLPPERLAHLGPRRFSPRPAQAPAPSTASGPDLLSQAEQLRHEVDGRNDAASDGRTRESRRA